MIIVLICECFIWGLINRFGGSFLRQHNDSIAIEISLIGLYKYNFHSEEPVHIFHILAVRRMLAKIKLYIRKYSHLRMSKYRHIHSGTL